MHEAGIAQSILDIAFKRLRERASTSAVSKISLEVGELRNVDGDSLEFAFDNLKGLYNGFACCQLEMKSIKALAWCHQANHQYNPCFENAFCCEQCGSGIGQLICGEELDLRSITFETSETEEPS